LLLIICTVLALVALSPSGIAADTVLPTGQAATSSNAPTVNPDRTVTFTLNAPEANEVFLYFQNQVGPSPGADAYPMMKGADGVWSVTIGPLAPDMYGYDFILDGVNIVDPANTYTGPGTVRALWAGNPTGWSAVNAWSYVTVPGPEADFFADAPVPHGAVAQVRYHSNVAQEQRMMEVYTPPGYGHDNRGYPVLYIMHGAGGNETDWIINMRANFILDNLIAQGKAEPMILVSANGYVTDNYRRDFTEELLGSIVPYIEENYRTAPGAKNRALAGLSLGGLWTTNTHFSHPGEFAYIGVFSSGFMPSDDFPESLLANPDINKLTRLLWIASGDETDITYNWTQSLLALLEQYDIEYTYVERPGGHVWGTWRHNLYDFAPLLFKK
jgi:enterochelin esterase-like enzyme